MHPQNLPCREDSFLEGGISSCANLLFWNGCWEWSCEYLSDWSQGGFLHLLSLLETRCLKTFSRSPEFPLWSVAAGFLKSGSPVVTFVALETLKMVFCRLSLLKRCFDLSNFLQSVLTTLLVVLPEFFLKKKLLIQRGNLLKWTSLEFGCYLIYLPVNCWFCYPNHLSSCVRNFF